MDGQEIAIRRKSKSTFERTPKIKPLTHANASVKRYGGVPEDYLHIHDWFDATKSAYADTKHRAVLHHTYGIFIAEQVFGHSFINSAGKTVHVRNVAEDHVMEDCGFIPTLENWLGEMPVKPWMRGHGMKKRLEVMGVEYGD